MNRNATANLARLEPMKNWDVLPVLTVGGRRYRDDRDRADLGGEKRQARRPPGHAPARQEKVDGVVLLPREVEADREQDRQGTMSTA